MITIWNRAELALAFSLEECERIRAALDGEEIPYHVACMNRSSPGLFRMGTRERWGTAFENPEASWQYRIYVKRGDLSRARWAAGLGGSL